MKTKTPVLVQGWTSVHTTGSFYPPEQLCGMGRGKNEYYLIPHRTWHFCSMLAGASEQ